MVQAKRVYRTQMPLHTRIITQRNDGFAYTIGSPSRKHLPGVQGPEAPNRRTVGKIQQPANILKQDRYKAQAHSFTVLNNILGPAHSSTAIHSYNCKRTDTVLSVHIRMKTVISTISRHQAQMHNSITQGIKKYKFLLIHSFYK